MDVDKKLLAFFRRVSFHPTDDACVNSASLFSPSLKSALFVNGTDAWKRTVGSGISPSEGNERATLVQCLYTIVLRLNTRLALSMASSSVADRKFAHNAMQDVPRQGLSADWFHGVLQVLLLDRVIYAVDGHSANYVPSYQRFSPPKEKEPDGLEKLFKAYRCWEATMDGFCETWETSSPDSSKSTAVSLPIGQENDCILTSLVREARRAYGKAKWNIIFNNFCFAAMGLRSLMLVSFFLLLLLFLGQKFLMFSFAIDREELL